MRKGRKLLLWGVAFVCALLLWVPVCVAAIDIDVGELGNNAAGDFQFYDTAHYVGQNGNPYYTLGECVNTDIIQCSVHKDTKVIGKFAFLGCKNLKSVTIPHGVTKIENGAFEDCINLKDVFFKGTKTEWANITAGREQDALSDATIHFCANEGPCTDCGAVHLAITKQPTNALVESGVKASVSVGVVGDGITYKWYYKNKGASKFTLTTSFKGNSYSVEMSSARAGRQVYCVITDKYGNKVTTNTVTLNLKTVAKITKQPTNALAVSGATAKVTVNAVGDGITYKWYYKNKSASKFTFTTAFKSNSYAVEMSSARAGRQVYCVITDKYGNKVTTNTVTLNLKTVAKITKQPTNALAVSGATAKVTVNAVGDGITYKWYYKNKGASKFTLTTSFTGNSYAVEMSSARADQQVYCVVTDKYGNKVTTNTVTLNLKTVAKITKQPTNALAVSGATAKVTVNAVGDGITYKWYYKNKSASKFTLTTAFKGNSYSVEMSSARAGRQVYCVITDKYGNKVTTNTVTLNLKTVAKITKQPTNALAVSGATAKVTVNAVGDGITYKWYYKNKSASKFTLTTAFKGNSYSVEMSSARAGRQVYCVITDKYGNKVTTNTVTLNLKTVTKITKQPVSTLTLSGATAKVTVGAAGDGLTYTWYYKDKKGSGFYEATALTGKTYSVKMTSARAGRQVYCVITDKYGNQVSTKIVTLKLKTVAKITKQPASTMCFSGETAKVTINAVGDGITYKWYYKDKGASKFKLTKAFTGKTYSIEMTSARASRQVYCVVTDKYGNKATTKVATLNIRTVAKITKQPVSTLTLSGGTAKATVGAVGDGLTYTWYYKDKKDSGFYEATALTGKTYSVKMTSARAGRMVYCIITDQYGNTVATNMVTLNLKK